LLTKSRSQTIVTRKIGSIRKELLAKSREAALGAVQTFNNPLTTFKSETFTVMMIIAWLYLLHAYYHFRKIDYRHYEQRTIRRHYFRTKTGSYKYWELEKCLAEKECPLDSATKSNLLFLIGLRNEIEHHRSSGIDERFTGRYLACCINYERVISQLFGNKYSLGNALSFTLQFRDITKIPPPDEEMEQLPSSVAKYLQTFDANLTQTDLQSPNFSYRLFFMRKLTNNVGHADRAFEFIHPDSPIAKTVDHQYWVLKETERKKFRAGTIKKMMNQEGYVHFNLFDHTKLWKELDAKNPHNGYGIEVVPGEWLWYERWIDVVRKHCQDNTEIYFEP
jgi:hypothetical protein